MQLLLLSVLSNKRLSRKATMRPVYSDRTRD